MSKLSKEEFVKKWARECSYNHDCHDCKYAPECGQAYLQIKEMIHHQGIDETWLPTVENKNALPEPIRKYIHDIETNVDPQGMVRENVLIRDTCTALLIKLEEKGKVDQAFVKKWADVIHQADTGLFGIKGELKLIRQMLKEAGVEVGKK
jgi:hypothetical protein